MSTVESGQRKAVQEASWRSVLAGYFFRSGGAYNIAICRVALFSCLYFHMVRGLAVFHDGGVGFLAASNLAAYDPKGLLLLFWPQQPPSGATIDVVFLIATYSTIAAIFGLATRISMILSVVSLNILGALYFSWGPGWSHPYNGELLAGIGFMFGRAGDTLSVDSVIRRYVLKRPADLSYDGYWWPVIFGLFGAASVYFGGAYAKLSLADFSFNFTWVLSDSLRNQAALPWLIWGRPFPWIVEIVTSHPLLWKTAAAAHIAMQALPILAILSMRHPWVRLGEGIVYIAGVFLLIAVMGGRGNLEWIWLSAFFIDFEFFAAKLGLSARYSGRPGRATPRAPVALYGGIFGLLILVFILARLDDRTYRAYPLSSMIFYAQVDARRPYHKHLDYPFPYGQVLLHDRSGSAVQWYCAPDVNSSHLVAYANTTPVLTKIPRAKGAVDAIARAALVSSFNCDGSTIKTDNLAAVDLFSAVFRIPAYPERAKFDVNFRALVARREFAPDRTLAATVTILTPSGALEVGSTGLDVDRYELLLAADPWAQREPDLQPLKGGMVRGHIHDGRGLREIDFEGGSSLGRPGA